ncbi:MAG: SMP-30/gluconolactonase/LRE family protein [Proteobacteria bacterium]|nr:SMP-30/gluconolactonase/LRE family protein [Pseudomonadota bacterium]
MSKARLEKVLAVGAALGEGPCWSLAQQSLFFVDIDGKRLHRFDPAVGAHDAWDLAENTGCVAPAKDGGFIAGMRSGIWRLDEAGRQTLKLVDNPHDPATSRFNDGRTDPRGRFLVGTIDEAKAGGIAALYRWDRRGLAVLSDGLMTSNGLAFSPDGRTLYHSDTPRFVIYRYDYDPDTGAAENRRVFARLDPDAPDRGRPDGAATDAEGCYWSSLWDGGRLHRYDPDGRLMSAHPLPLRRPTMPCFGGPDLKTLYVTTARNADGQDGGDLYAMPVETPGLAAAPFDPNV